MGTVPSVCRACEGESTSLSPSLPLSLSLSLSLCSSPPPPPPPPLFPSLPLSLSSSLSLILHSLEVSNQEYTFMCHVNVKCPPRNNHTPQNAGKL